MAPFDFLRPNVEKMEKNADIKGLVKALRHEDPSIRKHAAEALGRTRDAGAVEPLIQILNDKQGAVRMAAIIALGQLQDARAVEPLTALMRQTNPPIDSVSVTQIVKTLVKIGKPAVEPLLKTLSVDRSDITWSRITEVLGEIKDASVIEPMVDALDDGSYLIRSDAANVLRKTGWTPRNDQEKAYYLIARNDWEELVKLGEPAVKPLLTILKTCNLLVPLERSHAADYRKVLYKIKGSSAYVEDWERTRF